MPTVFHPALKGPEGRVLHRKFGPRGLIKYDRALSGSRSRDHAPNGPAHHRSGPARPWRLGLTLRFGSQPLLRLRAFTLLRARRPGFPPRASKASRAVEPDIDHPTRSLPESAGPPRPAAGGGASDRGNGRAIEFPAVGRCGPDPVAAAAPGARRPAAPTPPRGAATATGDGPPPLAGQARPAAPSAGIDPPVGSEAGQPPPRPSQQPRAERGAVSSTAGAAATLPASGAGAEGSSGSRTRKRSARGSPGGGGGVHAAR